MSQSRISQVLVVATMLSVQGCVNVENEIVVYDTGGLSIGTQADATAALIKHHLYASAMADYESESCQQALEKFNQIVGDLPLCAQAYNIRGCIYCGYAGTFGPRRLFDEKGDLETGILGLPKVTKTKNWKKRMISFYTSAIADFDRAIELEPEFVQAYNNRGQTRLWCQILKGEFLGYDGLPFNRKTRFTRYEMKADGSLVAVPKRLRIEPPGMTFNIFGVPEVDLEDLDLEKLRFIAREEGIAMADFFIATMLDPANVQAYINKGHSYMLGGNYPLALENFDKAISLDPQCTRAYLCRASLLTASLNRHAEAKKDLDKAIELEPSLTERGDIQMLKSQIEKKLGY